MLKIKDILQHLEIYAPPTYQEAYDNSGVICGDVDQMAKGVLISLDAIESVVDEAISRNCNLIVAHHPIVFKGLKSLTGKNYIERTIIKAIKNDIVIYAIHTNLDNIHTGVNKKICDKIDLTETSILAPKENTLLKLVTFVPKTNEGSVLQSLYAAGVGNIGNYSNCSFRTAGKGSFKPNDKADPHIGKANKEEHVEEQRIEVILPVHKKNDVITALNRTHPYEEVAYYLTELKNENQEIGAGMIGTLPESMNAEKFLNHLKKQMDLTCIRHTHMIHKKINKVAVCGGSGSFLLGAAKSRGADAFVTADFKYHEFFDAENKLMIADIGHYESEVYTKELLYDILKEKFSNFALNLSSIVTNPISYLS
ncbi:Nif3-like dinuclear metal center hexameric protein [Fulvivirga sp. M361]|uniref:Nif3-like dinuclear metal center hexameric protein n=1 Tax=Fulvivirga sp. M361 TaxID=2594266 RepID=UPI00117AA32F|nr:Nif3-like dinuclear metal center hexameric protein [Fulvivirga sp. M361]TRX49490.1 Nif3-like dinuclear metal center hexameric protein [Fulvivirga sp. M361]